MKPFTNDLPDWEKPLSRFNAHYWATSNRIVAALTPAEWSILTAIYCHLPNIECGKGRLAAMSGASMSSVKRARRLFKTVGLIDYDEDHDGGEKHDEPTLYRAADIRNPAIAEAVIERLKALRIAAQATATGGHGEPRGGAMMNPPSGHGEPTRGATMNPKGLKTSPQVSTQGKIITGLTAGAATASPETVGLTITGSAGGTAQPRTYTTATTDYVEDDDEAWEEITQDRPSTSGSSTGGPAAGTTGDTRDTTGTTGITAATTGTSPPVAPSAVQQPAEAASTPAGRRRGRSATAAATRGAMRPTTAGRGKSGLSNDQKTIACSSIEMMKRYILHGQEALDAAVDCATLEPTKMNFYKFNKPDGEADLDQWTVHEFAGFFWLKISEYRVKHNYKLELPNWGRLFKHIKDLLQTKTREQMLRYLRLASDWLSVIQHMNGSAGRGMYPNEALLSHKLVDMTIGQLSAMDNDARIDLWNNAYSGVERRSA